MAALYVLAEITGPWEAVVSALAVVQTVLLAWLADGPRRARQGRERRTGRVPRG